VLWTFIHKVRGWLLTSDELCLHLIFMRGQDGSLMRVQRIRDNNTGAMCSFSVTFCWEANMTT
jgi:hypothetical protein